MTSLRFLLFVALGASSSVAVEVSVCRDATYDISVDAASLCAGAGSAPAGWSCPKAGDVAVADCLSTLPSYGSGGCVAPEDAVCQVVNGDTWGCVLPSVGCNGAPVVEEKKCETWDYSGDDTVDLSSSGSFDGNEDYDESWFTKTTELREIYDCGDKPTPAPTTAAPEPTPSATETNVTEAPTPAPTPGATESNDTYTETETPAGMPTATPTPAPTECSGSSSAEAGAGQTGYGETEVGDEESAAGHSAAVGFAATDAATFGGVSAEVLAVIAAAVAFAAVVVAAVAIVYARKRHVKEALEEDDSADDRDEKDEDEDVESDSEEPSPVAPPTPAVVTGEMATTPAAASTKPKVKLPAMTPAASGTTDIAAESASSDNVSEGREVENADADPPTEAVAAEDD